MTLLTFNHLNVVEIENNKNDISINEVRIHLHRYLKNLKACKNEVERCEKVELFFAEIDKNKKLRDKFTSLKFTEHLDKLRNVHTDIMKLGKDIIKSKSERLTEKTPILRKFVTIAIEDLFKELEIAQVKNKELDYKPLYDELNRLSINFRNDVSRRVLHNKQKAEKKNKLLTVEPEESTIKANSSHDAQSFKHRTILLDTEELIKNKSVNRKNNDSGFDLKSLKQDVTVAALTKDQQLTPVEDGRLSVSTS